MARDRDFKERPESGKGDVVIPVVEEKLKVGKTEVERGGVKVTPRVKEQPATDTVTLREEHIDVERRATDRPVTAEDIERLQAGTQELTAMGEAPVIEKEARVVEEVILHKGVEEHTAPVSETVRRTHVVVEPTEGGAGYRTGPEGSAYQPGIEGGAGYRTGMGGGTAYQPGMESSAGYRAGTEGSTANQPGMESSAATGRSSSLGAEARPTPADQSGIAGEAFDRSAADYDRLPIDLAPLEDLEDFRVASGETDPRGWEVVDQEGLRVGKVKSLLASPSAQRVYFAVVDGGPALDFKMFAIPLRNLSIHEEDKTVMASFPHQRFLDAPAYEHENRNFQQYNSYWKQIQLERS